MKFQDLASRYLAEQMVAHPERDDCYIARLVVKQVSVSINILPSSPTLRQNTLDSLSLPVFFGIV
jgi:hypothetical protein